MGLSRLAPSTRFTMLMGLATLTIGCAANAGPTEFEAGKAPYLIPSSATRVAEGQLPLSYIPSTAATVYILDDETKSLVNTSEVPAEHTGDFFVIDPTEKAVMVRNAKDPGQRVVLAAPIDPSHRFSIWVVRVTAATQP